MTRRCAIWYGKGKSWVRYDIDGKKVEMPSELSNIGRSQVEYVEFNGWKNLEDRSSIIQKFIESETGVKIIHLYWRKG